MTELNWPRITRGDLVVVTQGRPELNEEAERIVEDVRDMVEAALSSGMDVNLLPRDHYGVLERARAELEKSRPDRHEQAELDLPDEHEPFTNRALERIRASINRIA